MNTLPNLLFKRIAIDEGTPVIQGSGRPVEEIIDLLATGATFEEILAGHEELERDDIFACIEYAYAK